mgnify:CR=1 FL=1
MKNARQSYFRHLSLDYDRDQILEVIQNQTQDWQVVWGHKDTLLPVLGFHQERPTPHEDYIVLTQYLRSVDIHGRTDRKALQRQQISILKQLGLREKSYFSLFFTEPCGIAPHTDNMQCSINIPIKGVDDPMFFKDIIECTSPPLPFLMNAQQKHYAEMSSERRYYFRVHFDKSYEEINAGIQ